LPFGGHHKIFCIDRHLLDADDKIPCILEPELTGKAFRKNWALLIQKIAACPGLDPGKSIHSYVLDVRVQCG
jgi:hypothetical protein